MYHKNAAAAAAAADDDHNDAAVQYFKTKATALVTITIDDVIVLTFNFAAWLSRQRCKFNINLSFILLPRGNRSHRGRRYDHNLRPSMFGRRAMH
jgi:hypothetical protein